MPSTRTTTVTYGHMRTRTPDPGRRATHTDLTVLAGVRGARARVRSLVTAHPGAPRVRPMLLASGTDWARVALVAEGALLLAGDHVTVSVDVGPGVHLSVVEPSGVVAYAMRGRSASWTIDIHQRPGSTLVWHGQPFVAADGAVVERTTTADLAADAELLLRETIVLGRSGESAGTVRTRSAIRSDGLAVLVEELLLSPATQVAGLLGDHRVLDTVLAIGPGAVDHPHRLDLEPVGHLYRKLLNETHLSDLSGVWSVLERSQSLTEV